MKKILSIALALCTVIITSCEKDTEGISSLTAYPQWKMEGKAFMNVKEDATGTFVDPGVKATIGNKEFPIQVTGSVDIRKSGIYNIKYKAVSTEGFPTSISRMVLVTSELVTNDYSGTYILEHATRKKEVTVKKVVGEIGYYEISDTWWQKAAIPVQFLDMGGTELMSLTNDSPFGPISAKITIDSETDQLKFEVTITGGPNAGLKYTTVWNKKND
ncbi:MAG: DUF5011 domain-containing protein [Bacteroides sp.]